MKTLSFQKNIISHVRILLCIMMKKKYWYKLLKSLVISKKYHLTCHDVALYHDEGKTLVRNNEVTFHFKNMSSHMSCNTGDKCIL